MLKCRVRVENLLFHLETIREGHFPTIRRWLADPEIAQLDGRLPMVVPGWQQGNPLPGAWWMIIDSDKQKPIGTCGYYPSLAFNYSIEYGILIGEKEYWDSGIGTMITTTFTDWMLTNRITDVVYLKVLATNTRAQSCFVKSGFIPMNGYVDIGGYVFATMYKTIIDGTQYHGR